MRIAPIEKAKARFAIDAARRRAIKLAKTNGVEVAGVTTETGPGPGRRGCRRRGHPFLRM